MENKPVAGDYVIILGTLGQYNGTPQMKNGWIQSWTTPTTIPAVKDTVKDFEKNQYTSDKAIISGVITEVQNTTYGNVVIADAEGNSILVYGLYNANGVTRYDAMTTKPVVGDTITVLGIVGKYNDAQMKNGWLIGYTAGAEEGTEETTEETPEETTDHKQETTEPVETPVTEGIVISVDTLGLESQAYAAGTKTIGGVNFEFIQMGNYGDGLQMRDKNGNTSSIWNTSAFDKAIAKIELVYSDSKDVQYSNANAVIFSFGNEAKGATYTTKLSTTSGVKTYTITPDAETYTYFTLEHDLGYTFYWKSITIVFVDGTTVTAE
jgi:hypothetical protein